MIKTTIIRDVQNKYRSNAQGSDTFRFECHYPETYFSSLVFLALITVKLHELKKKKPAIDDYAHDF